MDAVYQLEPEAIAFGGDASKPAVLARLADLFAASYALDTAEVLEALEEREALGSTGFGHGIAIPHARLPGLVRPVAALLKLTRPIDFAAADAMPVGLVFGLLSPHDCGVAHLHALAAISRMVRGDADLGRLRAAPDAAALYALLTEGDLRNAA